MYIKEEAFVIAKYPYKTSSLIVHFITKNLIIQCICYSAKKNSKYFGSDLEALAKIEIITSNIKKNTLHTLKETSILKNYQKISNSIYASTASFYIKEIISNIAHDFDIRYFTLIEKVFDALEENEYLNQENIKAYISILIRAFEIKALYIIGVMPTISKCVLCGSNINAYSHFSVDDGGVVCTNCIGHIHSRFIYKVDKTDLDFMTFIKHTSFIDIAKNKDAIKYNDLSNGVAKEILKNILFKHTSKKIKSESVLEEIFLY